VPLLIRSRLRAGLAILLLSSSLGAEYLPVKSYTIADGLMSDGEILHLIQDSRGYLWICGPLGISRFDGHAFRNYGQADGLPVEGAYYALETKDGTLWFGTSHGLARYVPNAGALKRFVMYSLGEPPAADGTNIADDIHMLCEDPLGGLWVGWREVCTMPRLPPVACTPISSCVPMCRPMRSRQPLRGWSLCSAIRTGFCGPARTTQECTAFLAAASWSITRLQMDCRRM
jgi:hypothetical protein